MFRQVFDTNNLFWRLISRGVDFVGLGLFWLVLCLPVVTVGPATSALYYAVVKSFRQRETDGFKLMLKSFLSNLKKGISASLICLPFVAVFTVFYLVMDIHKNESAAGSIMFVAYWVALLVPAGIVCWLFPIFARFETGLKDAFRTAVFLSIRHLPSTFVLVLLNMQLAIFTLERWWPIFFTPVLAALLGSLFLERIFVKYLSEEDRASLEGRYPDEEDEYYVEEE